MEVRAEERRDAGDKEREEYFLSLAKDAEDRKQKLQEEATEILWKAIKEGRLAEQYDTWSIALLDGSGAPEKILFRQTDYHGKEAKADAELAAAAPELLAALKSLVDLQTSKVRADGCEYFAHPTEYERARAVLAKAEKNGW